MHCHLRLAVPPVALAVRTHNAPAYNIATQSVNARTDNLAIFSQNSIPVYQRWSQIWGGHRTIIGVLNILY